MQDDGERDDSSPPNDPDAKHQTRAAIEAALTPDTYQKILAFARKRCGHLRQQGFRTNSDYEHQLVANVIADTYNGDLTWRPNACAFSTHICQAIIRLTGRHREHQCKFPKIRPATADEWDASVDPVSSLESAVILRELAASLIAEIESEFFNRRDAAVLAIVRAWRAGETKRAEISKVARISVGTYDNARERIGRFLDRRRHQGLP